MSDAQRKIFGCSFDGLKDRFSVVGESNLRGEAFSLADVVLPSNQSGQLLTGQQAKEARVSSGLSWPPEAKVIPGCCLRRVPIPYAWRLLVDAGDKSARWSVEGGISFPLTRILASHIAGCLEGADKDRDEIVIAIPNDLDELGQDGLLRDLKRQGFQNVRLVWRPVAAALAWLEKVQNALPENIPSDDFIIVIHLGPDCMEFVPFRLRKRAFQGKRYVVPLREPPKLKIALGGCDWAAALIESAVDTDDPGTFWQAFTGFPEFWNTLAQRSWNREELPRIWSRGDSWDLWAPDESIYERMWGFDVKISVRLSGLTRASCRLTRLDSLSSSWAHFLRENVKKAAEIYNGRLRGIILSGPLASALPIPWLGGDITAFLTQKGLRMSPSSEAVPDGIWIPGFEQDVIAEGAAIYSARLQSGTPTYLDTLPQLSFFAQDRGKPQWFPLLDADEVEGGKEFERSLIQKFSLPINSKNFPPVFLKKGKEAIKKASFHFPYAPRERMPLDTYVRMSPASGLAQVELVPIKKDFLRGQRVFLDYSTMEDATEADLPKPKLGSPPRTKIPIDPKDWKILSDEFKTLCAKFGETRVKDLRQYCKVIRELRDGIKATIRFLSPSNEWASGRIVDQDGKSGTQEGQKLINQISTKLESDIRDLLAQPLVGTSEHRRRAIKYICQAATWFFAGAPPEVISYLKSRLKADGAQSKRDIIEAAGRSFVTADDIKALYKAVIQRIAHPIGGIALPIHSARAVYRIMELREFGPALDAMTREDAKIFIEQALINMEKCVEKKNFHQIFFQNVKLFIYLLRYRETDKTFILCDNEDDSKLFDRVFYCLESAKEYFQSMNMNNKAHKIADLKRGMEKYREFEESPDIIEIINQFAESETDSPPTERPLN